MIAEPISPGTMIVANEMPPPDWNCWPIFGKTYAKTKTNRNGFMIVRIESWNASRRATRMSRRIKP